MTRARLCHPTFAAVMVAFVFLLPAQASAQLGEPRPVAVGYEYHPPVTYTPGATLGFHVFRAGLLYGFPLVGKTSFFSPALNYQLIDIDQTGAAPGASLQLHLLTLNTTVIHRFSERWTGVVGVGYGIASDLRGPLTGADLFVTGNVLALYTLTPELTLGAGVSYDRRTGSITPIPLGAVYWEPVRNFSIRGLVPASAYVSWRPIEPLTLEIASGLDGQRYNLAEDASGGHKSAIAYSLLKVGAGARVHLGKLAHVEVLGGALVARRFELFVDDRSQADGFIPAGPFVGVNLWIGGSGWKDAFHPQADPAKALP